MIEVRRYRRYFSYPIILPALLLATPATIQEDYLGEKFLNVVGVLVASFGQAQGRTTRSVRLEVGTCQGAGVDLWLGGGSHWPGAV